MRRFLFIIYSVGLGIFLFVYILSCLTSIISPLEFSLMGLLGLSFPYLFLLATAFTVFYLLRKKRLGWWLLAFWMMGLYNFSHVFAFHPGRWQMEKDSATIRVMSWNTKGFNSNEVDPKKAGNAYLEIIEKYNPDIICFQEYCEQMPYDSTIQDSKKRLDSLGYFGTKFTMDSAFWEGKKILINTGVAIFCKKYILIEKSKSIFDDQHRIQGYATADIVLKGKAVRVNTGRLASYGLYSDTGNFNKSIYEITYERKSNIQHQLRRTEQMHEEQVGIIRKDLDYSPLPTIYCGDMNSVPTSYNYFLLKGTNLQDTYLHGGWGIGATFYNIVPTLRIDLCLASKNFKVLQSTVIKEKISDHYPIVTDLQWK